MPNNVQASVRSYLGIAKETTRGTVVAPTDFIPVSVSKVKPDDIIDSLFDEGLRGSMVKNYNYIAGRTRSTFDFGGPAFPDTVAYPIAGLLGEVVTVGALAPYTHTISLIVQLPPPTRNQLRSHLQIFIMRAFAVTPEL